MRKRIIRVRENREIENAERKMENGNRAREKEGQFCCLIIQSSVSLKTNEMKAIIIQRGIEQPNDRTFFQNIKAASSTMSICTYSVRRTYVHT